MLLFANPLLAELESIPTNYFDCYSSAFGHGGSGNKIHNCFGINGYTSIVYKEIFAGCVMRLITVSFYLISKIDTWS
jgi:hypothetical protein